MAMLDYFRALKTPEHRLAWLVAVTVDGLQIAALPFFAAGGVSPADTMLDLVAAGILIRLLGFHWAFLPSLLVELMPGFDLFPTWTAAVFFVTHQQTHPEEPEILPPAPESWRR
jgi:hypothetical protein